MEDNHTSVMATNGLSAPNTSAPANYSCEEYHDMVRALMDVLKVNDDPPLHRNIYFTFNFILLPSICVFGILGNTLNLLILSRKHMKCSLDRMEKSVYLGLMVLAVSDMMQCTMMLTLLYQLPQFLRPATFLETVHLFFYTYREGLCNIFLFSSTWLTVLMAIGRYFAICHPIHARGIVKIKVTCLLIALIFLASVLASMPFFWKHTIKDFDCSYYDVGPKPANCTCMVPYRIPSQISFNEKYHYFWISLEFVIPLVILVYCNVCLLLSLKKAYIMQLEYRATKVRDPTLHITPTLVVIIILFIILISPAETLKFLSDDIVFWKERYNELTVRGITNFLQALNAAINFILYCIINVHFRKTIARWICCQSQDHRMVGSMRSDQIRTNHTTMSYNMSDAETEL